MATDAPWYVSNRQIHEELGIPFFADNMRALTEAFGSKLVRESVSPTTWKALVPFKISLKSPTVNRGGPILSGPAEAIPTDVA
jgi:hypothetical protein